MKTDPRVTPLDEAELTRLRGVAVRQRWPTEPAAVGRGVRRLSDAYNGQGRAPAVWDAELQAARLLFFLVRDTPKSAAAARELVRALPDRPLRLLDLGAGLGATALGVIRAWRAAGRTSPVHVDAADAEPVAASLAADILAPYATGRSVNLDLARAGEGTYDVILLGQVLCELDPGLGEDARADAHADLLAGLLGRLTPDGAVLVVEPALRPGTRHLMRVRDRLSARGLTAYAPCPHGGPCPMLPRDDHWCHEWFAVDLPASIQPIAKAAGLRWEGLSLARLVLRADRSRLPGRLLATSEPMASKGRADLWVCGEGAWRRLGRQDRHRSSENAAFDQLGSGVRFDLTPDADRVGPDTVVRLAL